MKMKNIIPKLIPLILLCASLAHAQAVTVSGNLKDLGLANATQQNTYVSFQLQNYGSNIPRVIGTNAIVSQNSPPFHPSALGVISGSIQSNDSIAPANTYYRVCIYFRGTLFQCNNYLIDYGAPGAPTWNLNTAVPITSVVPPPINPAPANEVFAGPPSGAPGTPAFRFLVAADIPGGGGGGSGSAPRFVATGTTLLTSDFILTGWGAGAVVSVVHGSDGAHRLTITAGTSPSVTPDLELVFKDGAWVAAPVILGNMIGGSGVVSDLNIITTASLYHVTYMGLPVAGKTYTFDIICLGVLN